MNGEKAIERIRRTKPDVILIDIMLNSPVDGIMIATEVQSRFNIPFIYITANSEDATLNNALGTLPYGILIKPINAVNLYYTIELALTRHDLEKKVREYEERYRAVINTAGSSLAIIDDKDRLILVNKEFERITGYSKKETENNLSINTFVSRDIYEQIQGSGRKMRKAKGPREVKILDKYGSVKDVLLSISPIEGTALKVCSMTDITPQRQLEKELLEISMKEQQRIGQDLHDGLGQHLTGIAFMSKVMEERLRKKSPKDSKEAGHILKLINEAIEKTRDIARMLIPLEFRSGNFKEVLEGFCDNIADIFEISCRLHHDDSITIDDNSVALQLYYILKEAVHNSVRHGKPRNIEVTVARSDGEIMLKVEDDGSGFDERNVKGGVGLDIMRYRASSIGASIEIGTRNEGGTVISCTLKDAGPRTGSES